MEGIQLANGSSDRARKMAKLTVYNCWSLAKVWCESEFGLGRMEIETKRGQRFESLS
jgi:hypothetical protein